MKTRIALFILLLVCGSLRAQDYDFIYSRPDGSSFECIITSDSTVSLRGGSPDTLGNLILPEVVNSGYNYFTVTAIADSAWYTYCYCSYLLISNTIKHIGDYAFYDCYVSDKIYFGTNLNYIGNHCFHYDRASMVIFNAKNCQNIGEDVFT